jgi:hypothetical protein
MFRDFERIYGAVKLGTSLNLSTNNLEKSVLKEIEAKTTSPL